MVTPASAAAVCTPDECPITTILVLAEVKCLGKTVSRESITNVTSSVRYQTRVTDDGSIFCLP